MRPATIGEFVSQSVAADHARNRGHGRASHGPCVCASFGDEQVTCVYCRLAAECPICHPEPTPGLQYCPPLK